MACLLATSSVVEDFRLGVRHIDQNETENLEKMENRMKSTIRQTMPLPLRTALEKMSGPILSKRTRHQSVLILEFVRKSGHSQNFSFL